MNNQEDNKHIQLVRQLFKEVFEKGNLSSYDDYTDKDIVVHCPPSWQEIHPSEVQGQKEAKQIDQVYANAFKYTNVIIHNIFANDNQVVVSWSCTGKHVGDFFGIAATNKTISILGQSIYRFSSNDKINEVWQLWDMLGLLKQIDAITFRNKK